MKRIISPIGRVWPLNDVLLGVGVGWRPLIRKLIGDLFAAGWDGRLDQVKEKFGGLRFYTGPLNAVQEDLVFKAEEASYKTCEDCGSPGTLDNQCYWVRTLCDTCQEVRRAKRLRSGL